MFFFVKKIKAISVRIKDYKSVAVQEQEENLEDMARDEDTDVLGPQAENVGALLGIDRHRIPLKHDLKNEKKNRFSYLFATLVHPILCILRQRFWSM